MSNDIIENARQELYKICKEPDKFRMCIPPQDDDTDMLFVAAFDYAEKLESEIKTLKERNAGLINKNKAMEFHKMEMICNVKYWEEKCADYEKAIEAELKRCGGVIPILKQALEKHK